MTEIRPFGTENSRPLAQPGIVRVQAAVIQIPLQLAAQWSRAELAERYQGVPLLVDTPVSVVSLFFDQHGEIHEHDAPFPILFIVIGGEGYLRVGGPDAAALKIHAGYAALWPAGVLHKAWTTEHAMQALTIEYGHR
jgi:quercetin dioxygenase-like cupin family protein